VPPSDAGTVAPVVDAAPTAGATTWSEHIAPLVYSRCASCHHPGGIGPFSLMSFDEARPMAAAMSAEVRARRMPPTVIDASGRCNPFRNDVPWLTEAEVDRFRRWAEEGAPQGDPSRAPTPPTSFATELDTDVRFDIGANYLPPPGRAGQYRCFVTEPAVATDRFVTGYQVVPGEPRVVHHVLVFSLNSPAAETEVAALDARDPQPGYDCYGGPGTTGSTLQVVWAPGGPATRFPDGTGMRLPGGRRLVMQVHYNILNGSRPDRTQVRFRTAASVETEARLVAVSGGDIEIPPRTASHTVEGQRIFPRAGAPRGVRVFGVAPHMHEIGRAQRLVAADTCLSEVSTWNFHWQRLFFYERPVDLPAEVPIRVACTYDSSTRSTVTRRGEGTLDEMCLNYRYVAAR
jgi:hypothetical protein